MSRQSWDEYFMDMAHHAATRATCDRAHVGAVVVRDRRVMATGYNGAPRGLHHCDDVGHLMVNSHCVRTVHAEVNALLFAGIERTMGATLYVTHLPCWCCSCLVINAGIARVVYGELYGPMRDFSILDVFNNAGIELAQIGPTPTREES